MRIQLFGAITLFLLGLTTVLQAEETGTPPPKLPHDFHWEGRYIVKDLHVNVPFVWNGNGKDMQMIAGSPSRKDRIYFTNLIYDDRLYTLTYKWPDVVPPGEPTCSCVGSYTTSALNACFKESRLVGPEILQKKHPLHVNHFRVTIPPFIEADIYVDQHDSSKFWQVLHFGIQNVYDPAFDEWIEIEKMQHVPGEVVLPQECVKSPLELKACDNNVLTPVCR